MKQTQTSLTEVNLFSLGAFKENNHRKNHGNCTLQVLVHGHNKSLEQYLAAMQAVADEAEITWLVSNYLATMPNIGDYVKVSLSMNCSRDEYNRIADKMQASNSFDTTTEIRMRLYSTVSRQVAVVGNKVISIK